MNIHIIVVNQIKSNQIFIAPLQQDHNMAIVYNTWTSMHTRET